MSTNFVFIFRHLHLIVCVDNTARFCYTDSEVIIMYFARRLKDARTEKGITQAELARMVGVSRSTICNYENGNRESPSMPVIMAIAKALHVPLSTFMSKEELQRRVPKISLKLEIPQYIRDEILADLDNEQDDAQDSAHRELGMTHEEYMRFSTSYRKLNSQARELVLDLAETLASLPKHQIKGADIQISTMPEDVQCDAKQ